MEIDHISARQIIDSRGNPTVEADVWLKNGTFGRAAVPSGASTGQHEAHELRDGGDDFGGKGVRKAVANIHQQIQPALTGLAADDQQLIDQTMIDLDGTENKSNLGANATLAVSLAVADAAAKGRGVLKYSHINDVAGSPTMSLPLPMMNLLNGGKHATHAADIQEFMIIPTAATTMQQVAQTGVEVFAALKQLLTANNLPTGVGDEGGFAVPVGANNEPLTLLNKACQAAGYQPGRDVHYALDVAASELLVEGMYDLAVDEAQINSKQMIQYLKKLTEAYPLLSIEDGLEEDDWQGWADMTTSLPETQIVGDDFLVTNVQRLHKAIDAQAGNAILIKPNQIGTLSETIEAIQVAQAAGWNTIVSHRSGETADVSIVHIAVGCGAGQIKTGSMSRSERVAKYNELLRLEEIDQSLQLAQPFAG